MTTATLSTLAKSDAPSDKATARSSPNIPRGIGDIETMPDAFLPS
jgi:hypothetical protein